MVSCSVDRREAGWLNERWLGRERGWQAWVECAEQVLLRRLQGRPSKTGKEKGRQARRMTLSSER